MALLNKSRPPAFPASQFLGSGFIPGSWEAGKAGGRDLFNKAHHHCKRRGDYEFL
jgi:hypothetical protein